MSLVLFCFICVSDLQFQDLPNWSLWLWSFCFQSILHSGCGNEPLDTQIPWSHPKAWQCSTHSAPGQVCYFFSMTPAPPASCLTHLPSHRMSLPCSPGLTSWSVSILPSPPAVLSPIFLSSFKFSVTLCLQEGLSGPSHFGLGPIPWCLFSATAFLDIISYSSLYRGSYDIAVNFLAACPSSPQDHECLAHIGDPKTELNLSQWQTEIMVPKPLPPSPQPLNTGDFKLEIITTKLMKKHKQILKHTATTTKQT